MLVAFQYVAHSGMEAAWDAFRRNEAAPAETATLTYLHIAAGILVLLLALTRIGLRLTRGAPPPPADEPWLLQLLSEVVHVAIYALLLVLPLSGLVAWFLEVPAAGLIHVFLQNALLAAIAAPFAWIRRHEDWAAFLLAWVVPAWVIFEAVSTKLPHYVMPLYPALAILAVRAMTEGYVGPHRPGARIAYLAMPLIPVGLTVGLCFGTWTLDRTLPVAGLPFLLAASAVAIASWVYFARGEVTRAAIVGVAAAPILAIGVFGFTQPALQSLKLSPRLAAAAEAAGCPGAPVATLGYREPSLVFLVGTSLDMVETGKEAADFLAQPGCRVLFVDSRFEPAFREALGDRATREPVSRVTGFNINGGRRADIGVYRAGQ